RDRRGGRLLGVPDTDRRGDPGSHRAQRVGAPRRRRAPSTRRLRCVGDLSLPRGPEGAMKAGAVSAGVTAWLCALLSSLCCLLPLAVIGLGLGSGAFMAITMRYRWLLIPAGVLGVVTGFVLYVRERQRCAALACQMAGSRVTLALLIVASLVVTTSIVLDQF